MTEIKIIGIMLGEEVLNNLQFMVLVVIPDVIIQMILIIMTQIGKKRICKMAIGIIS